MRTLVKSAALILLCAASCKKAATNGQLVDIQRDVALQAVSSCAALDATIQGAATRQMRAQLDQLKNGSLYPGPLAAGGAGAANAPASQPASYTTTNVQVAGVDEADFMKNDGTRIFTLSGGELLASTSWPPSALAFQGKLAIEGWPEEMFLDGNTVVVLSSIWAQAVDGNGGGGAGIMCPIGFAGMGGAAPVSGLCIAGFGTTKVTLVDVSSLSAMKVVGELWLPGSATHARRVGSSVRLVLTDGVRWPEGIQWWPGWNDTYTNDHAAWVAAIDALEDANQALIEKTPAQSWFPNGKRKLPDGTLIDVGYQCTDFYAANAPERPGLLSVVTLDLDHLDAQPARANLVAEAGVVYATAQTLYVGSNHWWFWDAPGQIEHTYLHAFDISDPHKAAYLASGGVDGFVLDQYSLDETDGLLRVAATTVERVSDPQNPWRTKTGSHVAVLQRQGASLAAIGDTGELSPGEGIRGARFLGDRAFVDTFLNIDPLITVDLSDPTRPRGVGALTLPGFSTYLQPIDATHLLAIGTDLPVVDPSSGQVDWSRRSMQLSVFDVHDLAKPARSAVLDVGSMYSWSEALYDPHAFNWYAQRGLLAIPFSDWSETGGPPWFSQFVSDVRVFAITPTSIAPRGSLAMDDVFVTVGDGQWSYRYSPYVRRSVLATDGAGVDYVYAVSDAGLRVAALNDLTHPIATALFPPPIWP